MRKFVISVLFLFSLAASAEENLAKEMYMPNDAHGFLTLTVEPCADKVAKEKNYNFKAYSSEENGAVHEGCWMSFAEDPPPGFIPVVNVYFEGNTYSYLQTLFEPEKTTMEERLARDAKIENATKEKNSKIGNSI